jgi:hypothetical protein
MFAHFWASSSKNEANPLPPSPRTHSQTFTLMLENYPLPISLPNTVRLVFLCSGLFMLWKIQVGRCVEEGAGMLNPAGG